MIVKKEDALAMAAWLDARENQEYPVNSTKDWLALKAIAPSMPPYDAIVRWSQNPKMRSLLREAQGDLTYRSTTDLWARRYRVSVTDGVKTVHYSY